MMSPPMVLVSGPGRPPRTCSIRVSNHQRTFRVDARLLRRITRLLLVDLLQRNTFDLSLHLVGMPQITRLNEEFLQHRGPTDVIAFDYGGGTEGFEVQGEIFICLSVAAEHAKRFRSTWQSELARYVVHGILHLCGYDDTEPQARARMKRAENRALKQLAVLFSFAKLGGPSGAR